MISNKTTKKDKSMIIDWLIEHFPAAFFKQARSIKPLQIGIVEEINHFYNRLDAPLFSKKALHASLAYYCTSPAYLRCQTTDAARIDLFGNEIDVVTSEQAKYAQQRYERQYLAPQKKASLCREHSIATPKAFEQPTDNLHRHNPLEVQPFD